MKSPTLIDLSHPIDHNVLVYPGDTAFHCTQHLTVAKDGFAVRKLELSSHVGTHVDAPSHRFDHLSSIDQFSLSHFIRPALVIDVSGKAPRQPITTDDIAEYQERIENGMAVLFMTGWSQYWTAGGSKYFDSPWLEPAVAQRLVDLGVAILGIDTMSPDQMPKKTDAGTEEYGVDVHNIVLGAGRIIAENLANLESLKKMQDDSPHAKIIVSLVPHNIVGCDGSPVRAYAWRED